MSSRSRCALLIVNARSRQGAALRDKAVSNLEDCGITVVQTDCGGRSQVAETIIRHRGSVDLVVVGGGDGTLNAAAPALMQTKLPLGVFPMGTANDLARTLNIPEDLGDAAQIIAHGHTQLIDLGLVNELPFFNVASIGLSATLAQELTREEKRRFGRVGYAIAALRVLMRARPFSATISSPQGSTRVTTLQIAVGNGRFYGGGNTVEKTAEIDDQRLDLYSLEFRRAWKLAIMARSFRYGEHGAWDGVRAIRSTEFEVRTKRRRPVNADGEIVTHTPAQFRLAARSLAVYAPPG